MFEVGSMRYLRTIFCIILALLATQKVSDGAGVIELKLVEYTNTFGWKSGNPKQCCDVMSTDHLQCVTEPCDPYFDICLQNMSHVGCGLGRQVTSYIDNQNSILFGDRFGSINTNNPLRFPVSQFFDNQMNLQVTVYDEDLRAGKPTNDKIDYMQQLFSYAPDFNGTHKTLFNFTLIGKVSSLKVQINIRCGTFYYGNSCVKQCRSDKKTYDCDSNGDMVCLPGWTGGSCGTNVDECSNNPCKNGASCRDGVNSFTCDCTTGFTGQFCENLITPSTMKTSTISSTSSKPTTPLITTSNRPATTSTTVKISSTVTPKKLVTSSSQTTLSKVISTNTQTHLSSTTPSSSTLKSTNGSPTVSSTVFYSTAIIPCSIFDLALNLSSNSVSAKFNVSGNFQFDILKQHIEPWLLQETKFNATASLKSQQMLGKVRQIESEIQLHAAAHLDIAKLKTVILSACSPNPGHYGKSKMPPPPQQNNDNPGPVIGGVFGGLVVAATSVVIGFFIYKRKREARNKHTLKKSITEQERNAVSKASPRDCGDGKSLAESDFEKREMKISVENTVQELEIPREDGLTAVDF